MNMPIAALPPNPMSVENAKVENNSFQYTSLQEMEQFTLPIVYQPSLAYAPIPFLSATASSSQAFEGSIITSSCRLTVDPQFRDVNRPSLAKDETVSMAGMPRTAEPHFLDHAQTFHETPHPRLFNTPTAPFSNSSSAAYHPPSQPPFAIPVISSLPPAPNSRKRGRTPESSESQGPSISMMDERVTAYEPISYFKPFAVSANSSGLLPSQSLLSQTPVAIPIAPSQPTFQPALSLKSPIRHPEQGLSTPSDFASMPTTNAPRENEIYGEIQASICQEVMRTR